jgi:Crp-like helix-turn-helix domain
MTHGLIARMLGVRREGVTEDAHGLQAAGLIRYTRDHISVLDRRGLERRSCERHAVVGKECQRLLPEAETAQTGPAGLRPLPVGTPEAVDA